MSKQKLAPAEYLKRPYARILLPEEGGGFSAKILEFAGCVAEGETREEALDALERAAESWLEVALDLGQSIPEPLAAQEASGKFPLRLPRGLHDQLVRVAELNRTSVNQYVVAAVAEKLGQQDALTQVLPAVQQVIAESLRQVAQSQLARVAMSNAATQLTKAVQQLEYSRTSARTSSRTPALILEERN